MSEVKRQGQSGCGLPLQCHQFRISVNIRQPILLPTIITQSVPPRNLESVWLDETATRRCGEKIGRLIESFPWPAANPIYIQPIDTSDFDFAFVAFDVFLALGTPVIRGFCKSCIFSPQRSTCNKTEAKSCALWVHAHLPPHYTLFKDKKRKKRQPRGFLNFNSLCFFFLSLASCLDKFSF